MGCQVWKYQPLMVAAPVFFYVGISVILHLESTMCCELICNFIQPTSDDLQLICKDVLSLNSYISKYQVGISDVGRQSFIQRGLVSTSFFLLLVRHLLLVARHLFLLASCYWVDKASYSVYFASQPCCAPYFLDRSFLCGRCCLFYVDLIFRVSFRLF